MSSLDQSAIDQLINQVQGTMEAPLPDSAVAPDPATPDPFASAGASPGELENGLAGDFDPPPVAAAHAQPVGNAPEFQRLLSIEVPVIVLLGQRRMTIGEVMRLAVGAIIEFNKAADEELELLVNNKPIGRGTAVKVGENFGIKVATIGSVREMIRKLGGQEE